MTNEELGRIQRRHRHVSWLVERGYWKAPDRVGDHEDRGVLLAILRALYEAEGHTASEDPRQSCEALRVLLYCTCGAVERRAEARANAARVLR